MAAEVLVPANAGNEYWVDIRVNGVAVAVQIDTGMTQANCEIGVALDGSEIETRIVRLESNLLGVCFFHRLPGFDVHWDLGARTMTIRRIT
jgi:predicted aspartyl protease